MERLLNVAQAAEKLSISPHTIRAWIFQKKLPYVRLGRRIGLRPEDIDSFIERNLIEAQERV
jgi:excisionase family DNA binding protein